MSHIQFGNFSIDFSKLKEGSEVDKNNEFLKSYDFDGNSIFSSNELNALQEDIEQAAGKDKTMQENETIALLAKKFNISLEEAKEKFAQTGNIISKGLFGLYNQQKGQEIGDILYKIIDDNFTINSVGSKKFQEAINQINSNNIISVLEQYKNLSKRKESLPVGILRERTASSKEQKNIVTKLFNELIKNIDTKKYDISQIKSKFSQLMQDNTVFTSKGEEELDKIFNTAMAMAKGETVNETTEAETTNAIRNRNETAVKTRDAQVEGQGSVSRFLDDVCGAFGGITKDNVDKVINKNIEIQKRLDAVKNNPQKYAEIFEEIYGVKYSKTAVYNYNKVNEIYKKALTAHNKEQQFKQMFENELTLKSIDDIYIKCGPKAVQTMYDAAYNKLCNLLGKDKVDFILNAQHADKRDITGKYKILQNIIKDIDSANKQETLKACGGKSLEAIKEEREGAFHAAFGLQNDALLEAESWVEAQQSRLSTAQMSVQILAMAGAVFTGGGTLALLSTAILISDPIGFTEKATDADGMTEADWKTFMSERAEMIGWMALGIGAGAIGAQAASLVKLKGLAKLMKDGGKSLDDLLKNKNLPADVSKQLKALDTRAKTCGVSTEVMLDITTTAVLQKDGATTGDWIMSIAGAIAGTKLQNDLIKMPNDKAVLKLQETFPELSMTKNDAQKVLDKILTKARELNKKANDWAKTETKSNGRAYTSIIPISPVAMEKAAKLVTRFVTDNIEKLFSKSMIKNLKMYNDPDSGYYNPNLHDAIIEGTQNILTRLVAGDIPSKEMLNSTVEELAQKYGVNPDELMEKMDAVLSHWGDFYDYFSSKAKNNIDFTDEIQESINAWRKQIGLVDDASSAITAKVTPEYKPSVQATPADLAKSTETINKITADGVENLLAPRSKKVLLRMKEDNPKMYAAFSEVYKELAIKICAGEVPSKEMFENVLDTVAQKHKLDVKDLRENVEYFMDDAGWDKLQTYFNTPEAKSLHNGKASKEVQDVVNNFKEKRINIYEEKPEVTTQTESPTKPITKETVETTTPQKEVSTIPDELAKKYKYELEQPFYDKTSETNLVNIMENYAELTKNIDINSKNIDYELRNLVQNNGIKHPDDIDTAVKLLKERFHKDILENQARIKNLSNKYNIPEDDFEEIDQLITELKTKMQNGEKITAEDLESMIYNIDARGSVMQRIEKLLYDDPDIKHYLNDCTHKDIFTNPEYTNNYFQKDIEEAVMLLDKMLEMMKQGVKFSENLIETCMSKANSSDAQELLLKIIKKHHTLGPLYKNL